MISNTPIVILSFGFGVIDPGLDVFKLFAVHHKPAEDGFLVDQYKNGLHALADQFLQLNKPVTVDVNNAGRVLVQFLSDFLLGHTEQVTVIADPLERSRLSKLLAVDEIIIHAMLFASFGWTGGMADQHRNPMLAQFFHQGGFSGTSRANQSEDFIDKNPLLSLPGKPRLRWFLRCIRQQSTIL